MPALVPPSGPQPARILVVGEAPGQEEEARLAPFVGTSGMELTSMLHDAGIPRTECRLTNVCPFRPAGNDISLFFLDKKQTLPGPEIRRGLAMLHDEIRLTNPNLIIALGNTPLWALTGERGITSWRGSQMETRRVATVDRELPRAFKVLPTYHPAAILRMWEWRWSAVQDLRRARGEAAFPDLRTPPYHFLVRPSYGTVVDWLNTQLGALDAGVCRISVDLETRAGHIACIGLGVSRLHALCIPFMCVERDSGYWSREEEFSIVKLLRRLLLHPNARIVGQNFLYDDQYLALYWGAAPIPIMDTMIVHHVCFPGLPKGLDYLSSLYAQFHRYWKDEGKNWDPKETDEDTYWTYNCKDAVITYEVSEVLERTVESLGLTEQAAFQMSLFKPVLHMMLRGMKVDTRLRDALYLKLANLMKDRHAMINFLAGRSINPDSPKQLGTYFYDTLGLPELRHRKTGNRTCDEDALKKIALREPLVRKLCGAIIEYRSLGTGMDVVNSGLDPDNRMRCSYNIPGTETFRFSSSKNAFGRGANLQNITAGGISEQTNLELPNLRCLFLPDAGMEIADVDLARADAQVVAWEADDADLKQVFREGLDLHVENAKAIWGEHATDRHRQLAKVFCHAANYGAYPSTLATALGISVYEATRAHEKWFAAHPRIRDWHTRIEAQLQTTRMVQNAFGFRRFYFERIEGALKEALAWIPQSTVAIAINKGLVNVFNNLPEVQLLLQVHDSLALQYLAHLRNRLLPLIRAQLLITIPYPDPLIIPIGFKVSTDSWGEVRALK